MSKSPYRTYFGQMNTRSPLRTWTGVMLAVVGTLLILAASAVFAVGGALALPSLLVGITTLSSGIHILAPHAARSAA